MIRLLIARYALDRVEILNRPPFGTASGGDGTASDATEGFSWTYDLDRHRYNAEAVEIWPREFNRPVADRIVIGYADQPGQFVHRARRNKRVEWCLPAATLDEALTFASAESAQAWVDRHGATEKHPLTPMYRSVAQALLDQSDAQVNEEMRG